jgi:hypothetical protein
MADKKTMSLRLDRDLATELEAVARIDGQSIADTVRTAVEHHIEARRKDEEFRERLRRNAEEQRDILDRLAT